jgi:glycosyltransferase involved in cell wall biosynthesis
MNALPLVSVLITVYNREAWLEQTLRSVLASSFVDFEVIVVDDCSRDHSVSIADRIAREDGRIRFVQNEANLGDYGNRMKAASLARGTFLKYVDSDDLIYPHTLQVMVDAMDRNGDAAIGLAHSMPEDEEPYPWKLTPLQAYRKHFLGRGCLSCGPTGAIIRKETFEAEMGFRKEWGVLSDTEFWLRLATKYPVVLLPPGLVWWRRHEGQEFTKDDAMEIYLRRGHELEMQALNAADCPLECDERLVAIVRRKQHYARRLLRLGIRQKRPGLATRLFRQSQLSFSDLARGLKRYQ